MKHLIVQVFMQSNLFVDKDFSWYSSDMLIFPTVSYLGISYEYFLINKQSNAVLLRKGIIYTPVFSSIIFSRVYRQIFVISEVWKFFFPTHFSSPPVRFTNSIWNLKKASCSFPPLLFLMRIVQTELSWQFGWCRRKAAVQLILSLTVLIL